MANGTEQKHTALFGRSPEAVLSAPGRTELCGNHTDDQSGRVIAAAIRRSITAAVSPRADGKCLLHTDIGAFEASLSTLAPAQGERGASAALVRGVAEYFAAHSLKIGALQCGDKIGYTHRQRGFIFSSVRGTYRPHIQCAV
ncbi:MAG: galactokinase family protein [Christensenellales bacterium]